MTAKVAMRGRRPLEGPLKVAVTAFLAVPASWSNKKRDAALAGIIWPVGRPDADNFQKAAWDSLNSIVWVDDSQVVDARIVKTYAERPSLRIEVLPFEALSPLLYGSLGKGGDSD
jgi:Holliday junction resolvase RusA-like endonuclease